MIKTLVFICCSLIPHRKVRKQFRQYLLQLLTAWQCRLQLLLTDWQCRRKLKVRYLNRLKRLQRKAASWHKIQVGFFVIYDNVFPLEPLFRLMRADSLFSPFIVVIPDVARGEEHMLDILNKTYAKLSEKYDNVLMSYDEKQKHFIDFSSKCDLVCLANPYDVMNHTYYKVSTLAKNGIPSIYSTYGYVVSNIYESMYKREELSLFWRNFVETQYALDELLNKLTTTRKAQIMPKIKKKPTRNMFCTGYTKMDRLAEFEKKPRGRKKIIIALHHTMLYEEFNISTFLNYADFFLELPQKYPDIDFVFRPHPLFKYALSRDHCWGKEKTEAYLAAMLSFKNVEYSDGDYFDLFVNSDALIHDCGSFMAEYLFTDNPACYLLKDEEQNNKNFNDFAKSCLQRHYRAYNREDIVRFIDEVVVGGDDRLREERLCFADKNLKINHPHVAQVILEHLKKEIRP